VRTRIVLAGRTLAVVLVSTALFGACSGMPTTDGAPPLTDLSPAATAARAQALGASDVTVQPATDGGFILGGKLDGDQFALAFPASWNRDGLLFAHGYSTPGTPVAVAQDPVGKDVGGGALKEAYAEGFAVGHSAYDKAGLGVQTGAENTLRLRNFLTDLGGKRTYVMGDSMGGGIVVTLLEMHPDAFAGGLARCGAVNSWETLIDQLMDMRVVYNFLTEGTPYSLAGEKDVRKNAIAPEPPASVKAEAAQAYVFGQMIKTARPALDLWITAQKNPDGREAHIIRIVTAIGGFEYDPASVAFPLLTVALGAEDMAATAGGWLYDNTSRVYSAPGMTDAEIEALNTGVQRVAAVPAARQYLRQWHTATGQLGAPLITVHNSIDSLVPYSQEEALARAVEAAGRQDRLLQFTVPAVRAPLPVYGIEGYTHCGFNKPETIAAWKFLRQWVETGARPTTTTLGDGVR